MLATKPRKAGDIHLMPPPPVAMCITNKTVTQFGGTITVGEVDPANAGLPAVQQYWDALETSNAIGNYGIDTTIPNYIVHHISAGACAVVP